MKKSEIPQGEGKVVEINGQKVAVYNDSGTLKAHSTVCPHLQCDVEWNASEKSWDCPCHGSKFKATGEVTQGPAEQNLDPVSVKEEGDEITLG
jgi:Rieske Fe-S protein